MARSSGSRLSVIFHILFALLLSFGVNAFPKAEIRQASSSYWLANINRQGIVAYGTDSGYKVYRNVKDYGAKGEKKSQRPGLPLLIHGTR